MIYAFIQARTDSTRLPGKVLKKVLNKPLIIWELERIKQSSNIDKIVLLTSNEKNDDELAELISKNNFNLFRGSKDDVLERYYNAGQKYTLKDNDIILRLTGDCPLISAEIIDELIKEFLKSNYDYMANNIVPIYPDGMDTEITYYRCIKVAHQTAKLLSEREHVTPFIKNSGLFKIKNLNRPECHSNLRLTLDEAEDYILIKAILEHFNSIDFTFDELIQYIISNPELLKINNHITRDEGYKKSLEKDKLK